MLNDGLAALSERLPELQQDDRGNIAREVADLRRRVVALEKAVKSSKKK
jgi:hypothetical protein